MNLLESPAIRTSASIVILAVVVLVLHFVARHYLLLLVRRIVERTRITWDQELFEHRVPHRASLIIPLLALQLGLPLIPGLPLALGALLYRLASAFLVLAAAMTFDALLSAFHSMYVRTPAAGTRPIKSYVQIVKVVLYVVAVVFMIARLADQSPWYFVSGLGAMMAIITLISATRCCRWLPASSSPTTTS